MAEQTPSDQTPTGTKELPDLVEASKLTRWQKTQNFVGFGYGLNTAISVVAVNAIRKIFASPLQKWEDHIAKKFAQKAIKKELGEVYKQLPVDEKKAIDEHYLKRGQIYAKKKIEGYLLAIGGFLVLPGQAGLENFHFAQNVLKPINNYRDGKKAEIEELEKSGKSIPDQMDDWRREGAPGISQEEARNKIISNLEKAKGTEDAKAALVEAHLDQQLDKQKANLDPIAHKNQLKLLNNAKEKPKYSPFGSAANELGRWAFGRVTALAAAFTTQTVVETLAGEKKEKLDFVLAKIFTKIFHPQGFSLSPEMEALFKDMGVEKTPEGIHPKVLSTVRMFTTDAYMTTAALVTHNITNEAVKTWEDNMNKRKAEKVKATSSPTP